MRDTTAVFGTLSALFVALCFFFYPGVTLLRLTTDSAVFRDGQPSQFPIWFAATAQRYRAWADDYIESRRAAQVATSDIAGTEWPLFGSVFFLASADELLRAGKIERDAALQGALDAAVQVVLDPASASWVRAKWGESYMERQNVFYRMLVVLGLCSYESATRDTRHHALQQRQAQLLADELLAAPYHLADDYPGECYPSDVLWAVVAIKRALGSAANPLVTQLLAVLDNVARSEQGIPAYAVDSKTGHIYVGSRGSSNSGLLSFAAELDPDVAQGWYLAYVEHHWVDGFVSGFREAPKGTADVMDVDSGPVLFGVGSVASLFGIGAARANGHFEHAVPLSLQLLAVAWPTPFGLIVPGTLGWFAADGWCFGELAISFALTRPTYAAATTSYDGDVPALVWLMTLFYLGAGGVIVSREVVYWRRLLSALRRLPKDPLTDPSS